MVTNLALFCLATYLATFQKIGQCFPNHLVTLAPSLPLKYYNRNGVSANGKHKFKTAQNY